MFISAMCEFVGLIYLQMSMSASSRVKRECASAYASTQSGHMFASARKALTVIPASRVAASIITTTKVSICTNTPWSSGGGVHRHNGILS
jgi:hypothetical protein